MPLRRVYLALAPEDLTTLVSRGELAAGRPGRAVVPGRAFADEEEQEYTAWQAAVADAAAQVGTRSRRVVAAVDVEESAVQPAQDGVPGAVTVAVAIPVRRFAAYHVDEVPGGDDADLLWYDATELDAVHTLAVARD